MFLGFFPMVNDVVLECVLCVPLSSELSVPTLVTSSWASIASWKAGSGSGDGVLGLSVAGDDMLLLHTQRHVSSGGRAVCARVASLGTALAHPPSPPNKLGVVSTLWTFWNYNRENPLWLFESCMAAAVYL